MPHTPTQADFTAKARAHSDAALEWAIADIMATQAIWRDAPEHHAYVAKLNAEFDAFTTERQRRQRGGAHA
jgi:hypothetical protein